MRVDGGGEYASNQFKLYCKQTGVTLSVTTPYTPVHNAKAERLGGALQHSAKSMLSESGMPIVYWPEAVQSANFARNRVLIGKSGKSPAELWSGKEVDLNNLRTFGSVCYGHISQQTKPKAEWISNSVKCVFLGNESEDGKYYKLLNLQTLKIIRSRTAIFEEERFYKDLPDAQLDSIVFEMPNDSIDDMVQPARRSGANRYYMRNLPPVDYSHCEANFLEQAFWIGDVFVPEHYTQAVSCDESEQWKLAMDSEKSSLDKNNTFTICKLPKGRKAISSKWVYAIKSDGRFKARLVAKGFTQKYGVDFDETFAPTLKMSTFRMILSQSVTLGLSLVHMDVVTAFLNGFLNEEIYLRIPKNMQNDSNRNSVFKLNKALYGLKQASRQWFLRFHSFILTLGFKQSQVDPCLYKRVTASGTTLLAIYVDDLLIASNSDKDSIDLQTSLSAEFSMKTLGFPKMFLGVQIAQSTKGLIIFQQDLIDRILLRFKMQHVTVQSTPMDSKQSFSKLMNESAKFDGPYRQAIGCLQYLVTCTRPDLATSVSILAQYTNGPTVAHWEAVVRIFGYLKGTRALGISYHSGSSTNDVTAYADSSWASDVDNRRSRTGYFFKVANHLISWQSKRQVTVALSTCEAEYMALSAAVQESSYLIQLCRSFGISKIGNLVIFQDNMGTLDLAKNKKIKTRTKHIDVRYHFIREQVSAGGIKLVHCPTQLMQADILTKALPANLFLKCRDSIGMVYAFKT